MDGQCRDSFGELNSTIFNMWTCSLCYIYLFPSGIMKFNYNQLTPGLFAAPTLELISNQEHDLKSDSFVCSSLGSYDCDRWQDCCRSAQQCCDKQLRTPLVKTSQGRTNMCPRTWDGWRCFEDTVPGTKVSTPCPSYILYGSLQGHVEKYCTENGTWALHPQRMKEWTDYSKCVNIKGFSGIVYASVAASIFSLLLLVPAVGIFIAFRQLRGQHRIQLHVCLFLSFVFTSVFNIMWEVLVYNDRLENPWKETFMFQKEKTCKLIYVLVRYATGTNYFWMFCEGFFLHQLLVEAFQCPRHIKRYFVIGWVGPSLPVIIYTILRWQYANDTCWVKNAGNFEWVLYTPNVLCIVINLIFLLSILRILLTQLHQHPNEPSNYRRALKATFVLVPLFGLQLSLVIYRPVDSGWYNVYEIISKIIIYSQGGIIAIIFCHCNGEVLLCIKNALRKLQLLKPKRPSLVTNYTIVSQKLRNGTDNDYNDIENNGCDVKGENIKLTETRLWSH